MQHFWYKPSCSSGWTRKHAFMSIFVIGHQRIILTGVLPIVVVQILHIYQVSHAWMSNCIPQNTVGCNYSSMHEIYASTIKVLINEDMQNKQVFRTYISINISMYCGMQLLIHATENCLLQTSHHTWHDHIFAAFSMFHCELIIFDFQRAKSIADLHKQW